MPKFVIKSSKDSNVDFDPIDFVIPEYSTLAQVFESFTIFLKACGYNLDGQYISTLYYDDLK
jgi:hypothetical protein